MPPIGQPRQPHVPPTTEKVDQYLTHRERELTHQIDLIQGRLAPLQQELAAVRKAMTALGLRNEPTTEVTVQAVQTVPPPTVQIATLETSGPSLTIKQMILGAAARAFSRRCDASRTQRLHANRRRS